MALRVTYSEFAFWAQLRVRGEPRVKADGDGASDDGG